MDQVYCTILSKYRVYQGMVLYRSLVYNTEHFKLYILCVDDDSYDICRKMNLSNGVLIKVEDLQNEQLISIRNERALNEYCWTLKPFLIEYALKQSQSGSCATYVDADICFFGDPAVIYEKDKESDVMLSEHDYSEPYKGVAFHCGKYNSGFIIFRNVKNAMKALKWWQDRCIEWCYDTLEEGKFGDQKYLDFIPEIFRNICSISTPGVNIAPWNELKHRFNIKNEKVYIGKNQVICYHFSGFRIVDKKKVALVAGSKQLYRMLHSPYIHVLKSVMEDIEKVAPDFTGFSIEKKFSKDANYIDI